MTKTTNTPSCDSDLEFDVQDYRGHIISRATRRIADEDGTQLVPRRTGYVVKVGPLCKEPTTPFPGWGDLMFPSATEAKREIDAQLRVERIRALACVERGEEPATLHAKLWREWAMAELHSRSLAVAA